MDTSKSPSWLKREFAMTTALFRSVPSAVTVTFIIAVIAMNFLARITLLSLPWLALNAGIFVSWLSFLFLDVVTKHFGAHGANILSLTAIAVNLLCCLVCSVISRVFSYPSLDMIVGGQWSILIASTIAYIVSALTNNYTNIAIGRLFIRSPDSKAAFAARSYISTVFSQILDNFIFVFLAFVVFPNIPGALSVRWTVAQCVGCSLTCAVLELVSEIVFSPLGYMMAKRWKERGVGREYLDEYCSDGVSGK